MSSATINSSFLMTALWAHRSSLPFLCLQTIKAMLVLGFGFYFVVLPFGSPPFSNSFVSSMQENTLRINRDIALPPPDFNHRACIIFLPKASAPGVAHIITWEYWQHFSKKNRGPNFFQVSWFNPSQQLSTTQPLAHSPPVQWGENQNLWTEIKTV